ncbi:MAG: glucosamine-6-phosphate deaminase [Anaerostipes sp.]|jgi:glucosamine-6-phosphate deaminase|nr:glucosamine-6-phosphate deaminase [Anaerostipes sp.]MDD3746404.1 glucosamine-6-phosphate deaminase [Anaerostipes sp.]
MKIIVTKDYKEMSSQAAALIAKEIKENPQALLALSTGSSPMGTYEEMIRLHKEEGLDFRQIRSLNMDEYIGLDKNHPQGYNYFMNHYLYQHVNIDTKNTFGPDAVNQNLNQAALDFDQKIKDEGGIDLILLGIGRDGHIAFNMPSNELSLATHIQKLSKATIKDNSRFFDDVNQVPVEAMTIGIENIFKSKKIVLVASGDSKSEIIAKFIHSETLRTDVPATLLKLHKDITVIVDKAAAQDLS